MADNAFEPLSISDVPELMRTLFSMPFEEWAAAAFPEARREDQRAYVVDKFRTFTRNPAKGLCELDQFRAYRVVRAALARMRTPRTT